LDFFMAHAPKHQVVVARPQRWRAALALGAAISLCAALGVSTYISSAAAEGDQYSPDHAIATDTFARSTVDGWGSAELGGAYSYSQAQQFSSVGGEGVATLSRPGSAATATLSSVSSLDTRVSAAVSVPQLPIGGNGVYSGLQLRSTAGSYYQAQARTDASGRVTLALLRVNGSTAQQVVLQREVPAIGILAPGQRFELEFQATGESPVQLRARAWIEDSAQPDWQISAEDASPAKLDHAGALGIWTYVSRGSPAQSAAYDQLEAFALKPAQPQAAEPQPVPGESPSPAPDPSSAPTPQQPGDGATPVGSVPPGSMPIDATDARGNVGAPEVGSSAYPVPASALFVATNGTGTAPGTSTAPLASIQGAIDAAPSGTTIVIRGGSYHESLVIPKGKALTLQPYPNESVWLDGSRAVSSWTSDGASWSTPWTVSFDSSPTYTRGAPDGTDVGWSFVNAAHPLAAHPDQLWLDGAPLVQVGSRADLRPGTFFVDEAAGRLYLGSDPNGHAVRASDTVKAATILGADSVVRGIGIRRFAPSVPDMGAVTVQAAGVTLENLAITDNATTGLSVDAAGVSLKHLTVSRNGMLGIHADFSDGLVATGLLVTDNNTEHFNRAPVAGGMKITRSRQLSVTGSAFLRNEGNALWFDESTYGGTVASNDIVDNGGNGLVIELSSLFTVANNVVAGSGIAGILISDSNQAQLWNNTVTGNNRDVNIVQGDRRASDLSVPGHDPRQVLPDPTVTWITGRITLHNNVLANSTGNCVLCVEDYSHQRSAAQMQITSDGNVLQRTSATKPVWLVVWSRGPGNPAVYTTLREYAAASGQDGQSLSVDSGQALSGIAAPVAAVTSAASRVAHPLSSQIAALLGKTAGDRSLGAWTG